MKKIKSFLIFVFFLLLGSGYSLAIPFTFTDVPSDDNPGLDLSANFSGNVEAYNTGQVIFSISNNGPETSTISSVYFEYNPDSLLANGYFDATNSTTGISFATLSNLNMPQGENISFEANFAQTAEEPAPQYGINVSETAAFIFDGDINLIISAMTDGDLRIGMHVINIGDLSDSYVSNPVPEPATALLLGIGLLCAGTVIRKNAANKL